MGVGPAPAHPATAAINTTAAISAINLTDYLHTRVDPSTPPTARILPMRGAALAAFDVTRRMPEESTAQVWKREKGKSKDKTRLKRIDRKKCLKGGEGARDVLTARRERHHAHPVHKELRQRPENQQYRTQGCPKCHTGTHEFVFDAQANDHYASCLNCGMQFYQHIEQVSQGALAQAPDAAQSTIQKRKRRMSPTMI